MKAIKNNTSGLRDLFTVLGILGGLFTFYMFWPSIKKKLEQTADFAAEQSRTAAQALTNEGLKLASRSFDFAQTNAVATSGINFAQVATKKLIDLTYQGEAKLVSSEAI